MRKVLWTALLLLSTWSVSAAARTPQAINLPDDGFAAVDDDEEKPDITARVARISFIRGDVQVRRAGNDEWEKGVLNLPLIEGDEIATGSDSRVEIQFNNYAHLRLDHDALLKLAVMKDEGVALSLSLGTANVMVRDLEKAAGYFEIDAPKTTVAVEKSGSYRIDAGKAGDTELRVSITGGGSGHVYSQSAGFTLKSGRSARVFLEGDNAGEWETADAAKLADDFEAWTAERDSQIEKQLTAAHYNKYYDQDIYGADDLNDNGEWIYTSTYGYVWRPFAGSINTYANWSPYRYGHWRWMGPYGWTWVNDEPWGWATYHYGRWVYDSGYWVWSPYGYYRPRHSWWFPALVSISIFNNNVCWYPLGFHHRWRNFSHHGNGGGTGGGPTGRDPIRGGVRVLPGTDTTAVRRPLRRGSAEDAIPLEGVVAVATSDFGVRTKGARSLPANAAREVIAKKDPDVIDIPNGRRSPSSDIIAAGPKTETTVKRGTTGAATRTGDGPLDQELKTKRIFGDRQPLVKKDVASTGDAESGRSTGAVARPAIREPQVKPVTPALEKSPRSTEPQRVEAERKPRQPIIIDRAPPPPRENDTPPQERRPSPSQDTVKPRSDPPARTPPAKENPPAKPAEKPPVVERKVSSKEVG
jgi:hypothetical protein